jgi:CYTH domain-containing protein
VQNQVKKIVITGGPCAGKDTGLKEIVPRLWEIGIRPFVVDEVVTRFFKGGIRDIGEIARKNPRKHFEIQKQIMLEIMSEIKRFENLAALFPNDKCAILLNRGPMDGAAYIPRGDFDIVLEENRLTLSDVRDSFDGVIHLVTTADGAEKVWQRAKSNNENEARWEDTPEQAIAVDRRTQRVWVGTPHFRILDNSTDWNGKVDRLFKSVLRILGEPDPIEIERRFLLKKAPDCRNSILRQSEKIFVEQLYLNSVDVPGPRIRKRSAADSSMYTKTWKKGFDLSRQEIEELISPSEYTRLRQYINPNTRIIRKHRHCFLYKNQYFELDRFLGPLRGLWILEIELLDENESVDLPPFLDIEKEVTGDPAYSNYELAKIK